MKVTFFIFWLLLDEIDEIWLFIEEKLKTPVPTYFKRILKACGFNNGLTIASIDDKDVQYFEQQVRNGNVSAYFENVDGMNVLDGSTKTVENFVFTRGHTKFLLSIRDFLKNCLEQNGTASFVSEMAQKPKTVKHKLNDNENPKPYTVHKKRTKYSLTETSGPSSPSGTSSLDELKKERNILLGKAITSLIRNTPEMYVKARVKVNKNLINFTFHFCVFN